MTIALIALTALALGALSGWIFASSRKTAELRRLEAGRHRALAERDLAVRERAKSDELLGAARNRVEIAQQMKIAAETKLGEAQRQLEEMSKFATDAKQQLEGAYARLSKEALGSAIEQLLQVVKPHLDGNRGEIVSTLDTKKVEIESLLTPVREMLDRYQGELKESEQKRSQDYGSLENQLRQLLSATEATRKETARVASALSNPKVSGTWGEQALRRCVEMAGMTEYCDFSVQEVFETKEKERIRPDLIVRLPSKRVIAIDAKAPLTAYVEAAAEQDEARQRELLQQHVKSLRRHVDALSNREYHENIGESLDFTVLFLGGEQFLYAALMADPALFEFASERKVYLATPTVLVPLLRAVAAGWRADKTEENSRRALGVAQELYERFVKIFRDIHSVGGALDAAVKKYNEAIRSIDTRLVPKARELQVYTDSAKEFGDLEQIDRLALTAAKIPSTDTDLEN